MKVSEQVKVIRNGFDNGTHSLFARLAQALEQKLQTELGMPVRLAGKTSAGKGQMSAVLLGNVEFADPTQATELAARVEQLLTNLRNPSNLLHLLEKT